MTAGRRLLRIGFLADGLFKLLVAVLYLGWSTMFSDLLGVPGWLPVLAALMVALSAAAEIRYALTDGAGTHTMLLVVYDGTWLLATLFALVLGAGAGGWVWLGFQGIASPVLAALFLWWRPAE